MSERILSAAAVAGLRCWQTQRRRAHLGGAIEALADSHEALRGALARQTAALVAIQAATAPMSFGPAARAWALADAALADGAAR